MSSAPHDFERIVRSGVDAWRQGRAADARAAWLPVTTSGHATPQLWLLMAQACETLGLDGEEHAALDQVLGADPRNPYALIMKGDLFTRAGDDRAAVAWYEMAGNAARLLPEINNDLASRLHRAEAARAAASNRFLGHIHATLGNAGVDGHSAGRRFAEALDILSGKTQPYLQEPTSFYYPQLPQIAFYDPADFDWAAGIAAAFPAIRAEAEAVLAGSDGIQPYVERPADRPGRPHPLLNDPRWSAFHLWQGGVPVEANAARCPAAMAALATAPIPQIRARSPMALFSVLQPHTHIPPHNGMINTRLICHLPLIVPPNCRLRVGNETRTVEAGKMMIFDDSIEHEAWNESDAPRAILLFEVWRPELTAAERAALTVMFDSITAYGED